MTAISTLELGTNDVARILGTTPRTVTRMCQRGEITHYVVGKRSIRFSSDDLARFLEATRRGAVLTRP